MKTFVVAVATVTLGVAVPVTPAPAVPAAAPQDLHPLYMQVVAHPDDELFFMNPDIDRSINTALPAITVYLTAGELTGNGATPAERARNRQRGLQNAYAEMAGVADASDATQSEWEGTPFPVAGRVVEMYFLRARPDVHLLFLNLPDGQLRNIDTGGSFGSVVPAGGLGVSSSRYGRTDVLAVLRSLMDVYRPTVLRSLDPEPDRRSGYTEDHADHVTAARFARDAAAGYPGPLQEVNYRGYNIGDVPPNLSAEQTARKSRILEAYYRYDREFGDSHGGDRWLSRMYHRWPRGAGWVARDARETVRAFVVSNGAPKVYSQLATGIWGPGLPLAGPGGRLASGLAVGRTPDGRLTVAGRRLSDHHLLASAQAADGSFAGGWTDLGNPNTGLGNEDQVGTPALAVNADGRLQVFVKNGGGGISTQAQAAQGGWSGRWDDLGGHDLQDGVAAVTGPQGRIEIFAGSRTEIQHWSQPQPNAALERKDSLSSGAPASPPQATVDTQGRISVSYREEGTGRVLQLTRPADGTWPEEPTDLGGSGLGQPTPALPAAGGQLIFARNAANGVSVTRRSAGGETFSPWADLGGTLLGEPAAAVDAAGLPVVFTIEPTGVSARRQTGTGSEQPFVPQSLGM
ncbi:PIG-L family deacetylase [Actinoplanes auranticolor]|uniref:PIG-L family deacetylase n=1 Tax=Actinoplanes auranticolor TaxID=47988 RepID=UPI001BB35473|nr:PIG-L family deacetylase [Actinoplanes auranticolor]